MSKVANRETVETVADFLFLGSKITAYGDCSHEIKLRPTWIAYLKAETLISQESSPTPQFNSINSSALYYL